MVLASCAKNPATGKYHFSTLSTQQEYDIGRQSRLHISNSKIYKDEAKQKYFNDLAQKIYKVGERPEKDLIVYFMNDDAVNASALPGYIFVNRGLMPFLYDEAALMAILAHEAGHINSMHMARKHSNHFLINWLLNSFTPGVTRGNKNQISQGFSLHHSRAYEYEADELSVRYLNKMDVPAENAMFTFKAFQASEDIDNKMANLNEYKRGPIKPTAEHLRTHPLSDKRVKFIADKSNKWYELLEPYRQKEFYDQIDGLVYGYSGRNGKDLTEKYDLKDARSGVYGFQNIAYFKKLKLKMTMPENYQARVMSSDPVGFNYNKQVKVSVYNVSDDKNIYAVDVVANMLKLTDDQKDDLKDQFRKSKQDGMTGREQLVAYTKSPSLLKRLFGKQTKYYYIYIKQLDDASLANYMNHFRLVVLSSNIKKSFDETMRNDILFIKDNLVELTKKQASSIKPLTIKVKRAKAGETIEQLSSKNIPYIHFNQEWFRIFNGLFNELTTEIQPGTLLKTVPNPNKDI